VIVRQSEREIAEDKNVLPQFVIIYKFNANYSVQFIWIISLITLKNMQAFRLK